MTAELIRVQEGDKEEAYEGLDVKGKVVFTRAPLEETKQLAVYRHGAAGMVTDYIPDGPNRRRWDLPDAVGYQGLPGMDEKAWAFVLSPRQADRLERRCQQAADAGRTVKVRADMCSRFFEGTFPNVHAVIPGTGKTEEDVIVIVHYCHPHGFANDDVSGVGAVLEMARSLHRLIETGKLARPRRSHRFLLGPEMLGSYAHLTRYEDDLPNLEAGINLDMVGAIQESSLGPRICKNAHRSVPAFVIDLLDHIIRRDGTEYQNLGGLKQYPRHRHVKSPFSGGSDHYILSDPTVNVPTPMMVQWLERHYYSRHRGGG